MSGDATHRSILGSSAPKAIKLPVAKRLDTLAWLSASKSPTGSKMLAERRHINVVQVGAVLRHNMAEMSCRAQISHCGRGAIALPFERRCETVALRRRPSLSRFCAELRREPPLA